MFNFLRKLFYFKLSIIFNCHHQEIVTKKQTRLYIAVYKGDKRREHTLLDYKYMYIVEKVLN